MRTVRVLACPMEYVHGIHKKIVKKMQAPLVEIFLQIRVFAIQMPKLTRHLVQKTQPTANAIKKSILVKWNVLLNAQVTWVVMILPAQLKKQKKLNNAIFHAGRGGKMKPTARISAILQDLSGGGELPEYEEPSENIDWLGELADWFGAKSVSTDIGEMSYEQVLDNEAKKGTKGGTGFKFWWLNSTFDDGPLGAIARDFAGIKSPFTYNSPKTSEFFNSVEQISGSEMERIQSTYSLVAEAVPNYGAPGSDSTDLSKNSTFEEVLSCGTGICRDQAGLLAAALRKQDIDASVVNGSEHAWVRVTLSEGSNADRQFDLDSTWYKDFVPLPLRK